MERLSLAVIFITHNEEFHIGAAIDNIRDIAEEVFVVDSGSTDQTVEIAEAKGAKVIYHKFENFGAQWNFALSLPIKSAWTMKMDPDERLTNELKNEISVNIIKNEAFICGFCFDRILWFMGSRMDGVRNEVVRIWRTGRCKFTDVTVNEHPIVNGQVVKLYATMDHYDSINLEHWVSKQNYYTTQEAEIRAKHYALAVTGRIFGTSLERRIWVKKFFYNIPFRYHLWFLYCFFLQGAWRSGKIGWAWAQMRVCVMRLVEYKWIEMNKNGHLSENERSKT